ncbi:ATP-grasp domain-containing protein [Candidatus Woesearchaeota archaeon]|nr:ATP-grasp domain-containing protein [Candidatus Woesearchaeota archaeon]
MIENYQNGKIGVLFTHFANSNTKKPFRTFAMNRSYAILARKAKKKGLVLCCANYKLYQNGILKHAWVFDKKWKKIDNVKLDIIYSRFNKAIYDGFTKNKRIENLKYKMEEQVGLFNSPELEEFCWDKCMVSELFPTIAPKTFLVNTVRGLKIVLPEIKSEKIVLKPRYGTLGEHVTVTTKDKLPKKINKNTVVQEFIDGSEGIKGLVKGLHDMRVIVINGEIDHCHVRTPKKGLLTANMALGGNKIFVPKSKIPLKAVAVVKRIDRILGRYSPRLFSVDFVFDKNQRPYVIECNGSPTMHRYAYGRYRRISYYDHVLEAIKSGIKLKIVKTA